MRLALTLLFVLIAASVGAAETYSFDAATSTSVAYGTDVDGDGWEAADEATTRTLTGAALSDGLVLHYWLDDTGAVTTVVDSSGYGNDGTATANASVLTTTNAKIATAFEFDGSTHWINAGSDASLKPTEALTVSTWLWSNTIDNNEAIQYRAGSPTFRLYTITDQSCIVSLDNGGGYDQEVTTFDSFPLTTGGWIHVAMVYSRADQTLSSYINGVLQADVEATGDYPLGAASPTDLFVGAANTALRPWDGLFDDVRIYNLAKSTDDIARIYRSGLGTQGRIVELTTNVNATPYQPDLPLTLWAAGATSAYISGLDAHGDLTTETLDITTTATTQRKYASVEWIDFDPLTSGAATLVTQPRMGVIDSDGNGNFDIRADWDLVIGNGADATSLTLTDEHWTIGANATLTLDAPASVHGTRSDIHYLTGNSYQAVWPGASDVRESTTFGFSWAPIYEFTGTLDLPIAANVKNNIVYDNETTTGTYLGRRRPFVDRN